MDKNRALDGQMVRLYDDGNILGCYEDKEVGKILTVRTVQSPADAKVAGSVTVLVVDITGPRAYNRPVIAFPQISETLKAGDTVEIERIYTQDTVGNYLHFVTKKL